MSSVLILAVVVVGTVAVAARSGRDERVDLSPTPWDLADSARRQITLLSGQAAVAITAVVLLVTLVRDRPEIATGPVNAGAFDTVLAMFLVAFLSFVGVAIQFVFLPVEGEREGVLLPRFLFGIAGIQHYRTLFLAWLALKPLVDTFGLTGAASLLGWLLGAAAFVGWTIVASAIHRLGLIRVREAFALPVVGIALGIAISLAIDAAGLGGGTQSALALTLVVFGLNAATFGMHALAPIVASTDRGQRLVESLARPYVLADLQATVVGLALLWLALVAGG